MAPEVKPVSSLPDLSASVKAKVAVSLEDQMDPEKMQKIYDSMATKTSADGLDLAAIASNRVYFHNTEAENPEDPVPLFYEEFPVPLPLSSVRLCVLYHDDVNVMGPIQQAARDIAAQLPQGTKLYLNRREHYHITVFMTSQPHDVRNDPYAEDGGGWDKTGDVPVPTPEVAEREFEDMERLAAAYPKPKLEVYRLVLTNTGTLLCCCIEREGTIARLRQDARETFPGGAARQSTILHVSLFRILTPQPLDDASKRAVESSIQHWSDKLRGMAFEPEYLWHVHEEKFTTVEGPRRKFPFQERTA